MANRSRAESLEPVSVREGHFLIHQDRPLRHCLATVAYRAAKSLRGAPESFAAYKASPTTRTPVEILAHMGDLMDWGLSQTVGKPKFNVSTPLSWDREVARFFDAITAWDRQLASESPNEGNPERMFQGPIADALNHVGQINMLRRMASGPVKGENYHQAEIVAGRVGPEQAAPRREF